MPRLSDTVKVVFPLEITYEKLHRVTERYARVLSTVTNTVWSMTQGVNRSSPIRFEQKL
jgi:hypothetical protein